jgi:hypothetical protein
MTASPRLGFTELAAGQAVPETTVNEENRYLEQGASYFIAKDKDLTAPPGSPADGDCYIVAASPTGAWAGKAKKLAFYLNTAWAFVTPIEGTRCYLQDENLVYEYDGSAWGAVSAGAAEATSSQIWAGSSTSTYVSPAKIYAAAAPQALTSGTTVTPDGNNGFNFSLTLAHNATLANPSNFKVGQSGIIEITQDGTGSRTMAYGSNWKFPGGSPTLSTTAGAIDCISYVVTASGRILCNLAKAFS